MFNPTQFDPPTEIARIAGESILQAAHTTQILKDITPVRPRLPARILIRTGNLLIKAGTRLKARGDRRYRGYHLPAQVSL